MYFVLISLCYMCPDNSQCPPNLVVEHHHRSPCHPTTVIKYFFLFPPCKVDTSTTINTLFVFTFYVFGLLCFMHLYFSCLVDLDYFALFVLLGFTLIFCFHYLLLLLLYHFDSLWSFIFIFIVCLCVILFTLYSLLFTFLDRLVNPLVCFVRFTLISPYNRNS